MYEERRIVVVVPAHNEARLLGRVLATMPPVVDEVIVVDDGSVDGTSAVALQAPAGHGGPVTLIRHEQNQGVGAAIGAGYRLALRHGADVVAVMAGDGQMDPADLASVVEPVAQGQADYVKGNRLSAGTRPPGMPLLRYLGVGLLTHLTRAAAGYPSLEDSQSGFTAISAECLQALPLDRLYPSYGYPNHLLILLGAAHRRVVDVPVRPIYGQGEVSGLRCLHVAPRLLWILGRGYLWRRRGSSRSVGVSPTPKHI